MITQKVMERTKNNTLPLDRMDQLEGYSMKWSSPVSEAVGTQVAKATESLAYVDMASGPMMRGFLGFLVRAMKAQRVLEIGTFIGTSAMAMAEAMYDVYNMDSKFKQRVNQHDSPGDTAPHQDPPHLLTIDKNKRYIELVKDAFAQNPYDSIIESVEADALQLLEASDSRVVLPGAWDLIFLDGDKAHYPSYAEHLVDLLRPGGVLVIDNVLWYGHVLDCKSNDAPNDATRDDKQRQKAVAIDLMNQRLAQNPKITTQILPFGDGLTLATRIQ